METPATAPSAPLMKKISSARIIALFPLLFLK